MAEVGCGCLLSEMMEHPMSSQEEEGMLASTHLPGQLQATEDSEMTITHTHTSPVDLSTMDVQLRGVFITWEQD